MSSVAHQLTARVRQVRRIIDRRRLDGRLPEPTARLLRDLAGFELWSTLGRWRARSSPPGRGPVGLSPSDPPPGRWRRWHTVGALDISLHELAHRIATAVLEQLESAGLGPFLVDHDGRHVHVGLPDEQRHAALAALGDLTPRDRWYLEWRRGHRRHLRTVRPGRARGARRAESWRVFACWSAGPGLVGGPSHAIEISFWTLGENGRRERLGHRGLQRFEPGDEATVEEVDGFRYPGSTAFPVGRSLTRFREPIDVVYTWVDGDDAKWRASFEEWRAAERPDERGDHAAHSSRYTSRDELKYSLRSLWLNAGWVRNIYVVTADQVPDWLVADDRLRVVPHREILPDEALPTFNSHAIESRLHHIDGLAEHFVYFNDDMFLGRAVTPEQFFTANGLARFFDSAARVPAATGRTDLAVDTAARRGQRLIDEMFGAVVTHKLHHAPYALRRSVMAEVEERFAEVVGPTTTRRFRHPDDLSIPSAFAHHYGFATGRSVPGELHVGYENVGSARLGLFLRRALLGRDFDAFCLNETERWEADPARANEMIATFLERYFPVPSIWERPRGR